jgi:hypothetical protein
LSPGSAVVTIASCETACASAALASPWAGFQRGLAEIAADRDRGPVGAQHGETVELADELVAGRGNTVQQPASGQAPKFLGQGDFAFQRRTGRQVRRRGDLADEGFLAHHLELLVQKLRSVRIESVQVLVDVAGPAQRCFARVPRQDIVDGGAAREHAGDHGEQTKNHQTSHNQPVSRADLFHVTTPFIRPEAWMRLV